MVYKDNTISLVIPAYNEERLIIPTLMGVPEYVDKVFVINDCSLDSTAQLVSNYDDPRIKIVNISENKGPGNAIIEGYIESLKDNIDIVTVCGADHQFDLEQLPFLLDPIIRGEADYVKGNRFLVDAKEVMPDKRYFGNILLSLLTRCASGCHDIFDTQDGFTAISKKVLNTVDLDLFWHGYGYVSDFIIKIAAYGFKIKDAPRRSIYIEGERQSQIKISKYVKNNLPMILKGWVWRIFNQRKLNKIRKSKLKLYI